MAFDDWMKNATGGRDVPAGVQNAASQVGQFAAQQAEAMRRAQAAQQQAQQVMDQQNLSVLETRLVALTAQEQEAMNAPRVVTVGGIGAEPVAVQHHLAEVLVALLAPGGEIVPAARHLLATSPNLRTDAGFLERAKESDRYFGEAVARYGDTLRAINDPQWWNSTMTAVGMAAAVTVQEQWQGNYGAGVRELVTVTVPSIMGVRIGDTGLRIRVGGVPAGLPESRLSALEALQVAFDPTGIDTRRLVIREDSQGNLVLDFNDLAFAESAAVEPVSESDA